MEKRMFVIMAVLMVCTVGGIAIADDFVMRKGGTEGHILLIESSNIYAASFSPGETVSGTITWQFPNKENTTAIYKGRLFGDWDQLNPIATIHDGTTPPLGETQLESFTFTTPTEPGIYILRMILDGSHSFPADYTDWSHYKYDFPFEVIGHGEAPLEASWFYVGEEAGRRSALNGGARLMAIENNDLAGKTFQPGQTASLAFNWQIPYVENYTAIFKGNAFGSWDQNVEIGQFHSGLTPTKGETHSASMSFTVPQEAGIYSLRINLQASYTIATSFTDITHYFRDFVFSVSDLMDAPSADTSAANPVASSIATLNGTVNPNGASTTVIFEYGITTSYGSTATATQSPLTGTSSQAVSTGLTGLTPGTTYHYRVKATNSVGTTYGSDETFTTSTSTTTTTTSTTTSTTSTTSPTSTTSTTTLLSLPTVTTDDADPYTDSATLNGTINPNGSMTYYYFEYGPTSEYGYDTPMKTAGLGTTDIPVKAFVAGLKKNTLYHHKLVAYNGFGTSAGDDIIFRTTEGEVEDSKAIIVAGGGPYTENNIWNEVEGLAACAYRALITQGYKKDIVYYLSPNLLHDVDGDGESDVGADATAENLGHAIKTWAQDVSQLVVFLVGHGGVERFKIGKEEELTVQVLDGWLDDAQNGNNEQVVVVYDACHSGSFFPSLAPPAGKERIIATSAKTDQSALILADGKLSFSNLFWTSMRNGDSFYKSFTSTKNALSIAFPGRQNAQIEGNGNGIGDEKEDKSLAGPVKIGLELKSGSDIPSVGSVSSSPRTVLVGNSAVIYAEGVDALEGVNNVWAVITPPGYIATPDTPVTDLPILDLTGDNGRYEGTYGGFDTEGTYNIAVFAEDKEGFISLPVKTTVTVTGDPDKVCLSVGTGLGIQVPCVEYNGNPYGFMLDFYRHPDDSGGYYWKLVMGTLSAGTGTDCIPIGTDLSMPMDCVSYNGIQYGFMLRFYDNPYDPSSYYWKMDMNTLEVR